MSYADDTFQFCWKCALKNLFFNPATDFDTLCPDCQEQVLNLMEETDDNNQNSKTVPTSLDR